MSRRRNDGPWRRHCEIIYGAWCRACGSAREVQADHIIPRAQGGPSVVENCLFLCREHHEAKTASRLRIKPEWLEDEQIAFLARQGWVTWDDHGEPHGRGCRHFEPQGAAVSTEGWSR